MIRRAALLVALAAAPALAQETIVVAPSDPPPDQQTDPQTDPVTEILDQIAPPADPAADSGADPGADPGASTLPQVAPPPAETAASAPGGVVRVLDKISGQVTDLSLPAGETGAVGSLAVTLLDCRYPVANPAGDSYALLSIRHRGPDPVFLGWMIASAPAVSAMDHPRYDVWALRCTIS